MAVPFLWFLIHESISIFQVLRSAINSAHSSFVGTSTTILAFWPWFFMNHFVYPLCWVFVIFYPGNPEKSLFSGNAIFTFSMKILALLLHLGWGCFYSTFPCWLTGGNFNWYGWVCLALISILFWRRVRQVLGKYLFCFCSLHPFNFAPFWMVLRSPVFPFAF